MEPTDLTIEILKSIRDEIRTTNERLDTLRTELSGEIHSVRTELSERIDQTNERLAALERRQVEAEVRLASELTAVLGTLDEVKTLLRENLSTALRDHERRIATLEARIDT